MMDPLLVHPHIDGGYDSSDEFEDSTDLVMGNVTTEAKGCYSHPQGRIRLLWQCMEREAPKGVDVLQLLIDLGNGGESSGALDWALPLVEPDVCAIPVDDAASGCERGVMWMQHWCSREDLMSILREHEIGTASLLMARDVLCSGNVCLDHDELALLREMFLYEDPRDGSDDDDDDGSDISAEQINPEIMANYGPDEALTVLAPMHAIAHKMPRHEWTPFRHAHALSSPIARRHHFALQQVAPTVNRHGRVRRARNHEYDDEEWMESLGCHTRILSVRECLVVCRQLLDALLLVTLLPNLSPQQVVNALEIRQVWNAVVQYTLNVAAREETEADCIDPADKFSMETCGDLLERVYRSGKAACKAVDALSRSDVGSPEVYRIRTRVSVQNEYDEYGLDAPYAELAHILRLSLNPRHSTRRRSRLGSSVTPASPSVMESASVASSIPRFSPSPFLRARAARDSAWSSDVVLSMDARCLCQHGLFRVRNRGATGAVAFVVPVWLLLARWFDWFQSLFKCDLTESKTRQVEFDVSADMITLLHAGIHSLKPVTVKETIDPQLFAECQSFMPSVMLDQTNMFRLIRAKKSVPDTPI